MRQPEQQATSAEVEAAALQFVRKISGTRKPSRADQAAFDRAVLDIAQVSQNLLETMTPRRARVQVPAEMVDGIRPGTGGGGPEPLV